MLEPEAFGAAKAISIDYAVMEKTARAALDGKRQPPMLERERRFAEHFPTPAVQGRNIGIVVGRDLLEIVDGGSTRCGNCLTRMRKATSRRRPRRSSRRPGKL
jgi:hypothetical protein